MSTPLVSVVLPCRNQADHIGQLLPQYGAALDRAGFAYELVVVPNASTDGTEAVVAALARADARLKCVVNPQGGWGRSVRLGLAACRGGVLVYTNTARTDPAALPDFVAKQVAEPGALVKAGRLRRNDATRTFGSRLYNLEARILFGVKTFDVNGTPKVFGRPLYERLVLTQDGDLLDLELMAQAHRAGAVIRDVPTYGFKRHGGKSSTTLKSAWKMYSGAMTLRLAGPKPAPAPGAGRRAA